MGASSPLGFRTGASHPPDGLLLRKLQPDELIVTLAHSRPRVRRLLVVTLTVILALAGAPRAHAHAFLIRSTPPDGSTLDRAPTAMILFFDENVLASATSFTLRSATGSAALRTKVILGSEGSRSAGPNLTVLLPDLARGSYFATWQVQSTDDLHRTRGSISFAVGRSVSRHSSQGPGPALNALAGTLSWIDVTGIALLLGALLLLTSVIPRVHLDFNRLAELRVALWRFITVIAMVESIIGIAILFNSSGASHVIRVLTSGGFGRLWLIREFSFGGVALLSRRAMHRPGGARRCMIPVLAVTAAALLAVSDSSHVGAGSQRSFAALLLQLHLTASGAWGGGVLLLAWLLLLERRRAGESEFRPLLRAFGPSAGACLAVALVTGIALTGRQVVSPDALLSSTYGRILILKVLIVVTAGLAGLRTNLLLRISRPVGSTSLLHGVLTEGAAILLTLAAGATLSVSTPARGPAFGAGRTVLPSVISTQVGDLVESAALSPNVVGQSWLRVDVSQTRRPALAPVIGVTVSLRGPDAPASRARPLTRTEITNRWESGAVRLSSPGLWHLIVTVQRVGRLDNSWRANWIVPNDPAGTARSLISNRPWTSVLDGTAIGLAAVLFGVGLTFEWSRRRLQERYSIPAQAATSAEMKPLVGSDGRS